MAVLLEIPRDLNKLCRTCMSLIDDETENFIIFENKQTDLCKMLGSITSLKISTEDGLPSSLCSRCVEHLKLAYMFINQCNEADNSLRKLLCDIDPLNNALTEVPNPSSTVINITNDLLVCKVCEKSFTSYYELSMHNITHNTSMSLTERFTDSARDDKSFITLQQRTDEMKPVIEQNSRISLTDKKWDVNIAKKIEKGNLKSNNTNRDNNLTCETCQETFTSPAELSSHTRKNCKTNNINMTCTLCEKKFDDLSTLSLHFLNHSFALQVMNNDSIVADAFFCEYCGQIFSNDELLCKHYGDFHKNEPNQECIQCEETFDREKELLTHNAIMHLDEFMYEGLLVEKVQCVLCPEKFSTKAELHQHSLTHALKRYVCRTCPLSFCTQHSCFAHREVHAGKKHICSICGKCLSSSSVLKSHIQGVHSVDLQYCCSICGKRFATSTRLSIHSKIHTSEKKYVCSYCGYSSHKAGDLAMHTRIHTSERPYKCTVPNCTMSFKTSSHLCHHVRRHFHIRKFKCNICLVKFSTNHGLKVHQMLHTGEKPYTCIVCNKTFRRKYHLKIHMKQHNGT